MKLYSKEYMSVLRATHKLNPEWADSAGYWLDDISEILRKHNPKTILDYGCGKGALKSHLDLHVNEYDPAMNKFNDIKSDVLICVDVLEHVEPEYTNNVLKHMASLYKKGFFIAVHCDKALSVLSDGRNAHINIKSPDTWTDLLSKHFNCEFRRKGKHLLCYG